MILAKVIPSAKFAPLPVEVLYHGRWWAAKLLEENATLGHIRWIQLGYDAPDQDEWIDLSKIRPLTSEASR
jgi:hypothetical protein